MPDKVGEYQVRVGTSAINFWPLVPGTTVAAATPSATSAPVAAGTPNTIATPPSFAIFDVLVIQSADPVVVDALATDPTLGTAITPTPSINSMPLVRAADGTINISFAVPIATAGGTFDGTLRLTAKRGTAASNNTVTTDLRIKAADGSLEANLFVFFVVHRHPPLNFTWVKQLAVDQAAASTGLTGVSGVCKVLRDNQTFSDVNRQFDVETDANGFITPQGFTRNLLGLPINWPLIFNVGKTGYIRRGHLLRMASGDVTDNLAPFNSPQAIRLMAEGAASLATKRFMVDAGHGVAYAHTARRSNEWYVAHKLGDRIIAKLTAPPFNVPAANIFRTRSAGFGLIRPNSIGNAGAPAAGAARFVVDLPTFRIRARINAVNLLELSDLLLTTHDGAAPYAARPVPDANRQSIITGNAATFTAIETRLNTALAASGSRVQSGSMRWDAAANDYVYTREPVPPATAPPDSDQHLPINTGDWFVLTQDHMQVLADRSARWSLTSEIGSGPPASGTRPAFTDAVRDSMINNGALDYMRDTIMGYVWVTPPHAWLDHGINGWGPTDRVDYFNNTPCDLYMTLHENAGGGEGGTALIALATAGTNKPPDDQIRIGKFFLKHVDGFDQGLRQGGVAREIAGNPATMLQGGNNIRDRYYYLESEFMDAISPSSTNRYRMQDMIETGFTDTVADQIVAAIVEIMLDRQSNMDSVTLKGVIPLW
jgi:hypothetical protein